MTYKPRFFSNTQVFFVFQILRHESLTIRKHDIQIWSSHLDVVSMEISVHCYGSPCHPTWEILPVWREINSRLWTGWAKYRKTAFRGRGGRRIVNRSKTF